MLTPNEMATLLVDAVTTERQCHERNKECYKTFMTDTSVSLDTMPEDVIVKNPVLSVFAPPSKRSSFSGLFRCCVVTKKGQFVMYYDGIDQPALRADKQLSAKVLPKYYIYDISLEERGGISMPLNKNNKQYVGKIRRDKNQYGHAFEVKPKRETLQSRQSLYILYDIPRGDPVSSDVRKAPPPRKARVALYNEQTNIHRSQGNTLAEFVSSSLIKTNSLPQVANVDSGLHVFSHKEPFQKKNGDYALDFSGRCRMPSTANMQLQDDDGKVVIQLGKIKHNVFNLDFRYVILMRGSRRAVMQRRPLAHKSSTACRYLFSRAPFNAVQAFGFAIAQLCDY